jgi:hypothetical protein
VYFGTTVTNEHWIQKEIKRRLDSGNVFHHSVQNILSCPLLSKIIRIRIHKTIILPVILYVYETWSLTLRGKYRLGMSEGRVLRGIFGPKRYEVKGGRRKLYNEVFHDLYSSPSVIRIIKSKRVGREGHVA